MVLLGPSHVVPKRPRVAAKPGFKSQRQSFSVAPFLTSPTIGHSCQHSRTFPALLGCHSKSGQLWPCGVEPIISKLLRRLCNQGELPPSYIMGWSHSHPPGSKHGHSCLTYPWNQLKVIDMLNDHARGLALNEMKGTNAFKTLIIIINSLWLITSISQSPVNLIYFHFIFLNFCHLVLFIDMTCRLFFKY